MSTDQRTPGALLGLFDKKERWAPSLRGWVVLVVSGGFTLWGMVITVYPFLAMSRPIDAEYLVVEGWVHPYALNAAVNEFKSHTYQRIVTTGGPTEGLSGYVTDYSTNAGIAASRLKAAGIPPELVAMAPSRVMDRDRTFGAAVALREWLRTNAPTVRRLNILTADAHSRRTLLLFQLALGDEYKLGVLHVESPHYDPRRWWRYSEGVKTVVGEGVSYIYAKFLFFPEQSPEASPVP